MQIEKSIGTVLRIDTHTATETRGRFVRLCVQIDVLSRSLQVFLLGSLNNRFRMKGFTNYALTVEEWDIKGKTVCLLSG